MNSDNTRFSQFEQRKQDHIQLALDESNQATGLSGFDAITLYHQALPDLNFDEIDLSTTQLGQKVSTPFLVSSMTAGHPDGININLRLMQACEAMGWAMGVGSQRRELNDPDAANEWHQLKKQCPSVHLLGNLGISQLIQTPLHAIEKLVEALDAKAMQIHLNPLQECIQPEGTPQFRGGWQALEALCQQLSVPVVVKETGCGMSYKTLQRLADCGVAAIDVSGLGGTHWGRIEGGRTQDAPLQQSTAHSFKNWGIATSQALREAQRINTQVEIWGSGGIRNGLDAAKAIALGASTVGIAKPLLAAAMIDKDQVIQTMMQFEYELKVALFCSGNPTIESFQETHHAL